MGERSTTVRIIRAVVGAAALAVIVVMGAIIARPYLHAGPERVVERFLAAVARRDLEAARELMTPETRTTDAQNLEQVLGEGESFTPGTLAKMGNYAAVEYTRGNGATDKLLLQQQRDGRWLVYGRGDGFFAAPEDGGEAGNGVNAGPDGS